MLNLSSVAEAVEAQKLAIILKTSKIPRFLFKNLVVSVRFKMKKISLVLALLILFFAVSCDSGIKFNNPNDINSDAYQGDSDQDTPDDDSGDTVNSDTDTSNTGITDNDITDVDNGDSDTTPEQPDNSAPDKDADTSDSTDDSGDSEPDEDADTESTDTADEDYTEDITDTGTEIGETRVQDCSELPENARWNTVSAIVQSWDGEKWVPSSKTSFNLEGSEDECRFKCDVNYGWNGSKCDAETRNVYCENLPEHAQWNDGGRNGTFAQSWNGEVWVPTLHDAVYSKTPVECGFICVFGYVWDGSQCDPAPTQSANCTGLPSGAEWNTASSITQTWDSEKWVPESTAGVYNETASTTECRYKCKNHYKWSGSACVADTKVSPCMNKPENSEWNTVSSITQTWDGTDWQPSTTGVYNKTASTEECRFKCNVNYTWKDSACVADTKVGYCPAKPDNTIWNGTTTFTQTWNGEDWYPQTYEATYNKTAGTCTYICDTGYAWNDGVCETAQIRSAWCQTPLPANTVWNTVDAITQTYTSSGWEPSTTPVYNKTPSENECRFKCISEEYTWNGESCISGGSSLPECSTSSGTPCYDSTSHLTWSKISSSMIYSAATTFCQKDLESGGMKGYGGFTDWRLPNIDELKTLLVWSKSSSCKVSEVNGHLASSDWTCSSCTDNCSDTGSGCGNCSYYDDGRFSKLGDSTYLWSSSLLSDYSSIAWYVNFRYGYVNGNYIDGYNGVRCVRNTNLNTGDESGNQAQSGEIGAACTNDSQCTQTYGSGDSAQTATCLFSSEGFPGGY